MRLLSLFIVAFGRLVSVCADDEAPVISTEEGKISGVVEEAANGNVFYSYYGIPFAEPPTGELRFKDPVAARKWEAVRDGSSMPLPCPQVPFGLAMIGMKLSPEDVPGNEDCLYLNVFTPRSAASTGDLPVMVYIHGGGFFAGGAEEYLPHVLLSKEIILVVIQYRLGFLGFLSTEDSVMPGNFGLKDQTLALEWVQSNIRNFGGDPNRVTIFGESAGSASVHYQMLSPKAKGLFNGAIMHSGTAFSPWAFATKHKEAAKKVGSIVGCNLEEGSSAFLKCLQTVDGRNLALASQTLYVWAIFPAFAVPRIDGDFLPDHPARLMKEGRYNKVRLIAGVTADEGGLSTHPMYSEGSNLIQEIEKEYSIYGPLSLGLSPADKGSLPLTNMIYNYYLGGLNLGNEYADDVTKLMGDHHFNIGHDLVSKLHAIASDEPTFRYELTHRGDMSFGDYGTAKVGQHWVTHADDLFYLFRGGPLLVPEHLPQRQKDLKSSEDLALREVMLTLWTNFARHGNPTQDCSLGFTWKATTPDDLRHLDLSTATSMKSDTRKEAYRFHLSLPTETNLILNPNLVTENKSKTGSTGRMQDEL